MSFVALADSLLCTFELSCFKQCLSNVNVCHISSLNCLLKLVLCFFEQESAKFSFACCFVFAFFSFCPSSSSFCACLLAEAAASSSAFFCFVSFSSKFFLPYRLYSLHVPGMQVLRAVALLEPNEVYNHMPAFHHKQIILHSASSLT